ncbi:hypothetical protein FKM82_029320 [Ascaphus truei]
MDTLKHREYRQLQPRALITAHFADRTQSDLLQTSPPRNVMLNGFSASAASESWKNDKDITSSHGWPEGEYQSSGAWRGRERTFYLSDGRRDEPCL